MREARHAPPEGPCYPVPGGSRSGHLLVDLDSLLLTHIRDELDGIADGRDGQRGILVHFDAKLFLEAGDQFIAEIVNKGEVLYAA